MGDLHDSAEQCCWVPLDLWYEICIIFYHVRRLQSRGHNSINGHKLLIILPYNGPIIWNMTLCSLAEVYLFTRRHEVTSRKIVSTLHSPCYYDNVKFCIAY